MSEAFDITKFTEIIKKLKELRDQNPNITKEDLARSLGAHFNRTITAEAVDAGIEYLQDHNLVEEKPADSHPETQPAQNEASTGRDQDASEKPSDVTKTPPDAAGSSSDAPKTSPDVSPNTSVKVPDATPGAPVKFQELKIPKDIRPVPIAEIDDLVRRAYKRDDITAIMKENFGQAYGDVVKQRIALWRQSHPVTAEPHPATPPSSIRTTESGSIRNLENTRVLSQPDVTPSSAPGRESNASSDATGDSSDATRTFPDVFVEARSLTDAEVISSLRSESGTGRV